MCKFDVENGGPIETKFTNSQAHPQLLVLVELPRKLLLSSLAFLTENYVKKGLSAAQISQEIVSSKSAVLKALREFNIPIREAHKPHGRESQPRYGLKRQKGRLAEFKSEQQVVEIVKKLREDGLTYRRICEILIDMGVPTKNRYRKWHPEMIRRILDN